MNRHTARRWVALAAALVSGVLLAWAHSLHPHWVAGWIAPIPLLATAVRERFFVALALGATAGAIASISLFEYMAGLGGVLDAVLITVLRALQWAVFTGVAWFAARRIPPILGVFVLPLIVAIFDLGQSVVSPHGSAGSLAYSQLDALPVIQIAALASDGFLAIVSGSVLIVFVLALFWNVVSYAIRYRKNLMRAVVLRTLAVPALVVVAALVFGFVRLSGGADANEAAQAADHRMRVALIATNEFAGVPDAWRPVWQAYATEIERLARSGADGGAGDGAGAGGSAVRSAGESTEAAAAEPIDLVLLPEKIFRIHESETPELLDEVRSLAEEFSLTIVVGVDERGDPPSNITDAGTDTAAEVAYNRAYAVSADGVAAYDKRHMIPGAESHFEIGGGSATIRVASESASGEQTVAAGLLICKDLDFPATVRGAARDAEVLLVPAWDFHDDAWFHSRIAVLRGVENQVPVVRVARDGLLTFSDAYGRVTSEKLAGESMTSLLVEVEVAR